MSEADPIATPRWVKIAVIVAAVLLAIVVVTSVNFSGGNDEPDRPNLIGFDGTTTIAVATISVTTR